MDFKTTENENCFYDVDKITESTPAIGTSRCNEIYCYAKYFINFNALPECFEDFFRNLAFNETGIVENQLSIIKIKKIENFFQYIYYTIFEENTITNWLKVVITWIKISLPPESVLKNTNLIYLLIDFPRDSLLEDKSFGLFFTLLMILIDELNLCIADLPILKQFLFEIDYGNLSINKLLNIINFFSFIENELDIETYCICYKLVELISTHSLFNRVSLNFLTRIINTESFEGSYIFEQFNLSKIYLERQDCSSSFLELYGDFCIYSIYSFPELVKDLHDHNILYMLAKESISNGCADELTKTYLRISNIILLSTDPKYGLNILPETHLAVLDLSMRQGTTTHFNYCLEIIGLTVMVLETESIALSTILEHEEILFRTLDFLKGCSQIQKDTLSNIIKWAIDHGQNKDMLFNFFEKYGFISLMMENV